MNKIQVPTIIHVRYVMTIPSVQHLSSFDDAAIKVAKQNSFLIYI